MKIATKPIEVEMLFGIKSKPKIQYICINKIYRKDNPKKGPTKTKQTEKMKKKNEDIENEETKTKKGTKKLKPKEEISLLWRAEKPETPHQKGSLKEITEGLPSGDAGYFSMLECVVLQQLHGRFEDLTLLPFMG
jgi:hypothetical protein